MYVCIGDSWFEPTGGFLKALTSLISFELIAFNAATAASNMGMAASKSAYSIDEYIYSTYNMYTSALHKTYLRFVC